MEENIKNTESYQFSDNEIQKIKAEKIYSKIITLIKI